MKIAPTRRNRTIWVLLALVAAPVLLLGCLDNLCTKRLFLYRDTQPKSPPPAEMALLIADPAILAALVPEAAAEAGRGLPWAPEQPNYTSDCYRLSIDGVDDRLVYQGLCMNITPTEVCEVRPGSRRVSASLELMGAWGRERFKDATPCTLEPGGVYFLHPDSAAAAQHTARLQIKRLPVRYDAPLRTKLMDWLRRHTQGRSLEN